MQPTVWSYQQREVLRAVLPGGGAMRAGNFKDAAGVPEDGIHRFNSTRAACAFQSTYRHDAAVLERQWCRHFSLILKRIFIRNCEPFPRPERLISMPGAAIETSNALRNAYRETFQDYADKLNALQRITECGSAIADVEMQAALDAMEAARMAHSSARDRLAKELMRCAASAGGNEQQIRKTAHLIWEFAGRPEGTAERDWQRAKKVVAAAAC